MAKVEKNKKENRHFFKDFKAELKKVIWPTPKQVVNNTTAVITIVLITAILVFVLDVVFETLNTHGVNGLKSMVSQEVDQDANNVVDDFVNDLLEENTLDENTVSE